MRRFSGSLVFLLIMLLLDFYVFMAIRQVSSSASNRTRTIIFTIYWVVSGLSLLFVALMPYINYEDWQRPVRTYIFAVVVGLFLAKLIATVFFLLDDIRRLLQWITGKLFFRNTEGEAMTTAENAISRSTFMSWLGLGVGTAFFGTLLYGFRNQYNYKVKTVKLRFPNLPASFRGMRILQFSDVHSGSFMNHEAVQHGVDMINAQKADLVLFTGDIVNDRAIEMEGYMDVFSRVKAPMGVYSTLGNHDYGDYYYGHDATGEKRTEKEANLQRLKEIHGELGWRLLLDEHVPLERGSEKIALIGVQNISGKRNFQTYGSMAKAYAGAENYPFKILMSHDPSHWDKEVNTQYKDVDLTLSGHTHGMQFGLYTPAIKWSPVQWVYKQWDGLYEKDNQKLYVNPGFGFIGYPGRVGILPELTVFELV
jgi:uncharacterized protein